MKGTKTMRLTLGEKFKTLRELAGKTEGEVAAYLKMSTGTYAKIEADFIYPKDIQIAKLGKLYGISYDQVLATGEAE